MISPVGNRASGLITFREKNVIKKGIWPSGFKAVDLSPTEAILAGSNPAVPN